MVYIKRIGKNNSYDFSTFYNIIVFINLNVDKKIFKKNTKTANKNNKIKKRNKTKPYF